MDVLLCGCDGCVIVWMCHCMECVLVSACGCYLDSWRALLVCLEILPGNGLYDSPGAIEDDLVHL